MVLALDPGKAVGVCYGRVGEVPKFDQWYLPFDKKAGNITAETYDCFQADLLDFLIANQTDEVIIEAPWARGLITDFNTLRLTVSLATITEMVCHKQKIFMAETAVSSARKFVAGPKARKVDVTPALKLRGLNPRSSHQADAGAVWLHRALTRAGLQANQQMAALYAPKTVGSLL
jgi:hypothetical protein